MDIDEGAAPKSCWFFGSGAGDLVTGAEAGAFLGGQNGNIDGDNGAGVGDCICEPFLRLLWCLPLCAGAGAGVGEWFASCRSFRMETCFIFLQQNITMLRK